MTLLSRQKWNSPKGNCKVGDIVLLKEEAELNRWPIAKIIATNKGNDGFVPRVRLMLGASNKVGSVARYLKRPVNKLVIFVENDKSWVRFPYREPKAQDVSSILRGTIC